MPEYHARPRRKVNITDDEIKDACKAMTELRGLLIGIASDGRISQEEQDALREWITANENLQNAAILEMVGMLRMVLADNVITNDEYAYLMKVCDVFTDSSTYCQRTIAEQELKGIIKGISADGKLTVSEVKELDNWISENEDDLEGPIIESIREITYRSTNRQAIKPSDRDRLNDLLDQLVNPIEETPADIAIEGKSFCLSGDFEYGKKIDVANQIILQGGKVLKNVTKTCHYVVVGGNGSADYAFGNYGTKVKKALVYQQQGQDIHVISELALFASLKI